VLALALLVVPAGWPQTGIVAALLGVVVGQGMVNHRRTDELIDGQHQLLEATQRLHGQQLVIEQQNASLASQVEARTVELRDANMHLAAANLELLELDRFRSAMLSNASHELRTPLTGILGSAQNLRDGVAGPLAAQQREYVQMIEHDSGRLIRVVNELLDAARVESGRVQLQREPIALHRLIDDVFGLLQPAAAQRGVALQRRGDEPVVHADADKIRRVLINLLDNAIKFCRPQGLVRVSVTNVGEALSVAVEDQGPGIDAADLPHLFERFYRGRSADGTPGSGLGLAIARNLARLHGGDIALDGGSGRGSRFVLSLPRIAAA